MWHLRSILMSTEPARCVSDNTAEVESKQPVAGMQDYKSVRVEVVICAILVNTQTHTETDSFRLTILLTQPAALKVISYLNMLKDRSTSVSRSIRKRVTISRTYLLLYFTGVWQTRRMDPGHYGRVHRLSSGVTTALVSTFISNVTDSSTALTSPTNISAVIYLLMPRHFCRDVRFCRCCLVLALSLIHI